MKQFDRFSKNNEFFYVRSSLLSAYTLWCTVNASAILFKVTIRCVEEKKKYPYHVLDRVRSARDLEIIAYSLEAQIEDFKLVVIDIAK